MSCPDSLKQYLDSMKHAQDLNSKWLICQSNQGRRWEISIPIVAGAYEEDYWIVNSELNDYGQVAVAIPTELAGCPKRFIVQVPDSIEVLQKTESELIAIEELL
ncbi:hypothetical protein [Clostridium beijerinckii]|uniref:Uncharacterized protein n=1 Tax=Clostridium beijerinckii TaxID=1520 RepID=A0AAW3W620_CLOBE|nr:hypothetical protein [Clostridium beijerinckii]MBC2457284.1 hypothetical protein [Clostridium beijerinckii]MBC2474340.1 hypothetical protein [Clostridium beijerinckii]NOV59026.1 hypothetical protein [Clostridium beijerinckii]NOV71586.1 hypothetical protein [Clostridium beijerinckii]NOW32381.1 hypothetical protein [Clostridium beijerinckii]